jgi:flagellar basal-body rod protein FlgG
VGFKSDNMAIKKFNDVFIQNYDKITNGRNERNIIGSLSFGSQIDGVNTDFTQGMIEDTGIWSDFAIDGRGFFQVSRNENGINNTYYTRDGHFHTNSNGILVNDSGDEVLASQINANGQVIGNPAPISLGSNEIKISGDGSFSLNGLNYKLATADFADYNTLKKLGDNLYQGTNPIQNAGVSIRQNSLEKSNVNVLDEMVNMMTVLRTFESNQKVVQSIDETLNKAVNEVGTVK